MEPISLHRLRQCKMDDETTRQELVILLCHYLRQRCPSMYERFSAFCASRGLVPAGMRSMDEALDIRYKNFPTNQFHEFLKSLRPDDDFPSIFRRIAPFDPPPIDHHFECVGPVMRVYGHTNSIFCFATDHLRRILATGSEDIKLWRIPDMCPIARFSGHEGAVTQLDINITCTILLSSSRDRTIRLWSLECGRCLSVLSGASEPVNCAVFSPIGSMIVAGSDNGAIQLWTTADAIKGRGPVKILWVPERCPVVSVSFSPGSEFLSYACTSGRPIVMTMKKLMRTELEGHTGQVDVVAFSKAHVSTNGTIGPRLVTISCEDGSVGVWRIENGTWKLGSLFRQTGQGRRSAKLWRHGWDVDEQLLVIVKTNGVYVCDTMNGGSVLQIQGDALAFESCQVVVAHPVRKELFLLANNSGAICLIDVCRLCVVPGSERRFDDGRAFVDGLWSRDGEYLFLIDQVGFITVFRSGDTSSMCVQLDLMTSSEKGITSEFFYCDRKGKRLDPQPVKLDLRRMNLKLGISQCPALRDCTLELNVIREMADAEPAPATPADAGRIDPPPLHIRITNEYPVNPHAKAPPNLLGDTGIVKAEETFRIVSEVEDWNLSEFDIDQIDDTPDPPGFMCSMDIPEGLWPEWVTAVSCDEGIFVPQVGEEVVFSKKGYLKMLQNRGITEDTDKITSLEDLEHMTVCHIDPCENGARLSVQPLKNRETREKLTIFVPVMDIFGFIVPITKYRASNEMLKTVQIGDTVSIPWMTSDGVRSSRTGTVKEIRPNWSMDPYESITIEFNYGAEQVNIFPWEITEHNGVSVSCGDLARFGIVQEHVCKDLETRIIMNPKYAHVIHFPDPRVIPGITTKVQFPMSMIMIRERLQSAWYRTFVGIMSDIRLLAQNVDILFDSSDPQYGLYKEVAQEARGTLESWFKRLKEHRDKMRVEQQKQ